MTGLGRLIRAGVGDLRTLAVVVALLAVVPVGMSRFAVSVATTALIFGLAGIGWNVLSGYAGQFSFGHAAYFGIGAYTVAVLLTRYRVSPWVGLVAGGILAAGFAVGTGWLSFRFGLKGAYFALATFALAEMLRLIANSSDFLNAGIGIHIPLVGGDDWARLQFGDTPAYSYYVVLVVVALSLIATILLARSKLGSSMMAVREDEEAASALGVAPLRTKLWASAISGFITAIAGGFYVQFLLFIEPNLAFGPLVSVAILLRPIVGGVGTIWGPVVGAAVLSVLGEATRTLVRQPPDFLAVIEGVNGLDQVIFGIILILVIIRAPEGVLGLIKGLLPRRRA